VRNIKAFDMPLKIGCMTKSVMLLHAERLGSDRPQITSLMR